MWFYRKRLRIPYSHRVQSQQVKIRRSYGVDGKHRMKTARTPRRDIKEKGEVRTINCMKKSYVAISKRNYASCEL